MIEKILIANRGEIAVRIIRACKQMGIRSVAVFSDVDEWSLHVELADEAVRLPGKLSTDTYLHFDKILSAIKNTNADAVHPGYGFLSENADFAKAVTGLGVKFIGPSASAIHDMGDKVTAKKIMDQAGVPTVPGSDGAIKDLDHLKNIIKSKGYPMILKAAAGGGGRGMRVVRTDDELKTSYESCKREAQDYFGNDEVFCERYIENARHIEFQILCDSHGNGVHLFERDCSIQRRHQKLIEEAPSIFLNEKQRASMGETALAAAKAVNYEGAGTVEFICESPEKYYFMEMNTRIQVEHPVTEMITGTDLICEQIKVANGEKLTLSPKLLGHAIELRINAEDPERDFMPAPGFVDHVTFPSGPNIRVDSHLRSGYRIPEQYDSMVAKIIGYGENRTEAIACLKRALGELKISGVPTSAAFHEAVLSHKKFVSGDFYTHFLQTEKVEIYDAVPDPVTAAIVGICLSQEGKL